MCHAPARCVTSASKNALKGYFWLLPGQISALGQFGAERESSLFQVSAGQLVPKRRRFCPFAYISSLDSWGFMRETALSPLSTSTGCFTKTRFHTWILPCYIWELQKEPLRAEHVLLENREWWFLQFLPHSGRGRWTPRHLTSMITHQNCLLHSSQLWWKYKKKVFSFRGGVCLPYVCACVGFSCAISRKSKIKQKHRRGGFVRVLCREVMWQSEFVPEISRKRALAAIISTHML